jgi:hypothetical protein
MTNVRNGSQTRKQTERLKRLALLVLLVSLLLPISAQAQSNVQVDRMQINIWPEYDRRSILVIYRLSLAQSTLRCRRN